MKFTVHTSRSEAVCSTSGGKMISYTHDKISCLLPADSEKLPVCFQTVSGQKNNADGKEWRVISESDFASGFVFTPVLQMPEKVTLTLEDNTDTHKVSPCLFQLTHTYTVSDSGFAAKYTLYNRDKSPAAYRLDSEPVFCLPLPEGTTANEYRLEISAVDAVLTAENDGENKINDFLRLDGSKDNIISLADIVSDMTTLAVDEHQEKQIRLVSEKTGKGLQIELVGFRSLTVQLYKNPNASHMYLRILNYVPDEYAEPKTAAAHISEPSVPAGGDCTVGYVVTIL